MLIRYATGADAHDETLALQPRGGRLEGGGMGGAAGGRSCLRLPESTGHHASERPSVKGRIVRLRKRAPRCVSAAAESEAGDVPDRGPARLELVSPVRRCAGTKRPRPA